MPSSMLTGFTHQKIAVEGCVLDIMLAGEGTPLLLLHGFPETKLAWHTIAPELTTHHRVILADLPGYGDSTAPAPDDDYENCSKRSMANALVQAMHQSGYDQFAVAGHDRGARVAYRMALDHPEKITRLVVLSIVPTIDMVEPLNYTNALALAHWFLMAQPPPFPETLIANNPDYYLGHIFTAWAGRSERIATEAKAEYLRCFKDNRVIASMCAEYRATKWDIEHDREDRRNNRRIQCPVLALWSKEGTPASIVDPMEVWKKWTHTVSGGAIDGGHFLMEENPEEVLHNMQQFLNGP